MKIEKSVENISGSEAIIRCLLAEGVETVFGYPGGAIMPFYDALYQAKDDIRHILVRHEQGAAHAAEGYARASGRTGVCIATSGPGATNLVTGIADAMMDSIPLVCITGQVGRSLLGSDAFQETDVISLTIPITKWNYQITEAKEIASVISKAFYIARAGRPGPVVIDVTKNAQFEKIPFSLQPYEEKNAVKYYPALDLSKVGEAAEVINSARKPLLMVGHGVLISGAEKELIEFSEKAGIPVASTLLGLSAFPNRHPLYVGMLGMHGNYAPNILTNEADVIIGIGMRFDDRVTGDLKTYATQAKLVHIDIDAAEISKNVRADYPVVADAREALQALIPLVDHKKHSLWLEEFHKLREQEEEKVIKNAIHPSGGKVTMAEAINLLSEITNGEAIIVSDVGQNQMMTARYYRFAEPNSSITSGGLGTMGFALPAAVGAKVGAPGRVVIAIMGDGGFQMNLQELGTIMQEKEAVKIVVLNNNYLGMVRQWQQLFFDKRYSSVSLHNPDFIKICEGFGIKGEKVEERGDLEAAIKRMLASKEAYILELIVEKEENVFPMVYAGAPVHEMKLEAEPVSA